MSTSSSSSLQIVHRNGWYAVRSKGWFGLSWRYWVMVSDGQVYSHSGIGMAQWLTYENVWSLVAAIRAQGYQPQLPLGETTPVVELDSAATTEQASTPSTNP